MEHWDVDSRLSHSGTIQDGLLPMFGEHFPLAFSALSRSSKQHDAIFNINVSTVMLSIATLTFGRTFRGHRTQERIRSPEPVLGQDGCSRLERKRPRSIPRRSYSAAPLNASTPPILWAAEASAESNHPRGLECWRVFALRGIVSLILPTLSRHVGRPGCVRDAPPLPIERRSRSPAPR